MAQEPYSVIYCKRYEPWGIVSRRLMPWFDVRFRGYGRNKIIFAAALNSSEFSFVVDDISYVIHRPHEATKGSVAFSTDARLQVGASSNSHSARRPVVEYPNRSMLASNRLFDISITEQARAI